MQLLLRKVYRTVAGEGASVPSVRPVFQCIIRYQVLISAVAPTGLTATQGGVECHPREHLQLRCSLHWPRGVHQVHQHHPPGKMLRGTAQPFLRDQLSQRDSGPQLCMGGPCW